MQRILLAIAALLLPLVPAEGTSVRPLTLDELVRDAHIVLVGTVTSSTPRENPDDRHVPIWTDIRLEKLTVLKGEAASPLVVSCGGGTLEKRKVLVAGMPDLVVKSRYALFLRRPGTGPCPFLGWGQGVYRVTADELLLAADGTPVREVSGGRVELAPPDEDEEDRPRLALAEFRAEIETRARRQEAEARETESAKEEEGPVEGSGEEAR